MFLLLLSPLTPPRLILNLFPLLRLLFLRSPLSWWSSPSKASREDEAVAAHLESARASAPKHVISCEIRALEPPVTPMSPLHIHLMHRGKYPTKEII